VNAQENRLEVSTFENSVRDYGKTHGNAWEYWGLTKDDWEKYESIKQKSPWSVWKSEATPLSILSFYTSSIAEKRRYARLAAELDQWRENSVLEWQAIYNKEREIVFAKNAAVINARKPILANIRAADRVVYFAKAGQCDARCRAVTSRILATAAHIDIFLFDATAEEEIYQWATLANIPIDRVHVKQITLNFENGSLPAITSTPKELLEFPVAFVRAKDGFKQVIFQ
jgi:integrating conjugative element protein (TIGR03759 family)